ncbi:MAG: RNA-binding S4 domain-containing protein [Gammaproteobacteria bacterium]|nr:RNA-binding S4 domain-containing protein [Gammaproteobacteria bacterium]
MKDIKINKEPVELYKILKFEGIADSGGEAKAMIDAGLVMVNGQVEMRKRNKIVSGTIIEVAGHQFKIVFEP